MTADQYNKCADAARLIYRSQDRVQNCAQCGKEYTARRTPGGWYSYCSKDCERKMEVVAETQRKIARGEL